MTPNEIRGKQFERKRGAYRIEEVGEYLIDVAQYVEEILEEKSELEDKLAVLAEKLEEYRADEESLRAALIGAQKLGDSVVREAKEKAEKLLLGASQRAEQMIGDAKSSIDREALELTRVQSQVTAFKNQVLDMYRRQIESIMSISDEYQLPEVELSVSAVSAQPAVSPPEEMYQPAAPVEPTAPEPQFAAPVPETAPPPQDGEVVFKRAEKVDSFVLSYDELEELPDDAQPTAALDAAASLDPPPESPLQHRKRSNFGDLRFGEEYNLTRKE